jgi:D-alanyl-D-alanine carboxypeptidase
LTGGRPTDGPLRGPPDPSGVKPAGRTRLTRGLRLGVAGVLGLALGAGAALALQRPPSRPGGEPAASTSASPAAPPTGAAAPAPLPTRAATAPADRVLLAWTPNRLPAGLAGRVRRAPGVRAVTVVKGGRLDLAGSVDADGRAVDRPPRGMAIPLEAIAFDPASYTGFLPASARAAFRRLGPAEALLGATSARLRRLGPGGRLRVSAADAGGRRGPGNPEGVPRSSGARWLTVAGVVDDALVGAAEVAVSRAGGRALGLDRDRYALLAYRGTRAAVARAVRRALPAGLPVRLRGPGETPFFRAGDAVLPQAMVKERFGEFAWRPAGGGDFTQDPAWRAANLATGRVPILGRFRCNRALLPALAGAMRELERRNLARLVDPAAFAGCWNPRLTRSGTGVSRHAWGAAVDLNTRGNPTGLASSQDPRLVEVMERWGFTWGGRWLIPDPAHFEYLRPPAG